MADPVSSDEVLRSSNSSGIIRIQSIAESLLAKTSLTTTIVTSPRSSDCTLLNKSIPEDAEEQNRVEDRSWGWRYLRKRFAEGKLESLYQRYILRIQIAYFSSYLLVQTFLSCLMILILILYNYTSDKPNTSLNDALPEIIRQVIILMMSLFFGYIVWDEAKFHSHPFLSLVTSVTVVSVIHLSDIAVFVYYFLQDDSQPITTLSTIPLLVVLHFFLPVPDKRESVILGFLISVTSVLCKGILYSTGKDSEIESTDWKSVVLMDSILYLCVNVIGIYALFLREIDVRRAFLDRRRCLKSTIKNEIEKGKEDQLLRSILPKHISEKVKAELLSALQLARLRQNFSGSIGEDSDGPPSYRCRPFSDMFVERHNDMSILFADIVNFTKLASLLQAAELVECLNTLYARFDSAAKENKCLRIKLLGDCYYCVSSEARNCIEFGFEMIEILKSVRDKYQVNVAMRIGVHTGSVLSGLLGMYKWQYDIWSKDVTIANCMESAGRKDMIHISKATKEFLGDEYRYTPGSGQERSEYLKENNIETYFVVPIKTSGNEVLELAEYFNGNLTPMPSPLPVHRKTLFDISFTLDKPRKSTFVVIPKRATGTFASVEDNINSYRLWVDQVDDHMASAIDELPFTKANLCCRKASKENVTGSLSSIFMNFDRISLEFDFQYEDDPLFKHYVSCTLFVLVCQGAVMLISGNIQNALWISYACGTIFMILLTFSLWVPYLFESFKDPKRDKDVVPKPKCLLVKLPYNFSILVTKSIVLRFLLYIVITQLISTFAIINVMSCSDEDGSESVGECSTPWYFTYSCALAILVMHSFFRIYFMMKLSITLISLIGYGYIILYRKSGVYDNQRITLPGFSAEYTGTMSHMFYLITLALLLHIMDRQMEYNKRLNFLWKSKLKEENEEALITHEINTILIRNILPLEIANIYLDSNRMGEGYSRDYMNVAVMFATIPKFMDSFTDEDISGHGYFLQILNEIITEFDQVLVEHQEIEKIKVVGSTYMAACGLEVQGTSRLSIVSSRSSYVTGNSIDKTPNMERRQKVLGILVNFAASLMTRLDAVNKDAFQHFKLRVGIACGPLVAGVIGAEKPMYDIWGNIVNVASRMDSTGEPGKIQVNDEGALLLMKSGIQCEYRGPINVKGKGLLKTYFVSLTKDHEVVHCNE